MAFITISDKNTGDSLTASEFNQILDAIKDGTKGVKCAEMECTSLASTGAISGTSLQIDNVKINSTAITNITSDGSDNSQVYLSGGGDIGGGRGGMVTVYGNEHATQAGDVVIEGGVGGDVLIKTSAGTLAQTISGANTTFAGAVSVTNKLDVYDGLIIDRIRLQDTVGLTQNIFSVALGSGGGGVVVEVAYGSFLSSVGSFGGVHSFAISETGGTTSVATLHEIGDAKISATISSQTVTFSITGHASLALDANIMIKINGATVGSAGQDVDIVYTVL